MEYTDISLVRWEEMSLQRIEGKRDNQDRYTGAEAVEHIYTVKKDGPLQTSKLLWLQRHDPFFTRYIRIILWVTLKYI